MRITFYGVRGTSPVIGADFLKYGGETTSVLIEGEGGERIILDGGTGLRKLGNRLVEENAEPGLLLLMTHYHLDHLMGLPAFAPLYNEKWKITASAPIRDGRSVEEVLTEIFSNPFWPLQVETLPARLDFLTLSGSTSDKAFHYGDLLIRWVPLHHPGGSTAYRVDEPATSSSFVFATAVEWVESSQKEIEAFERL